MCLNLLAFVIVKSAVYEFMEEFLPHMEEEENTFQPLLCKYFNYEELKLIKVKAGYTGGISLT